MRSKLDLERASMHSSILYALLANLRNAFQSPIEITRALDPPLSLRKFIDALEIFTPIYDT